MENKWKLGSLPRRNVSHMGITSSTPWHSADWHLAGTSRHLDCSDMGNRSWAHTQTHTQCFQQAKHHENKWVAWRDFWQLPGRVTQRFIDRDFCCPTATLLWPGRVKIHPMATIHVAQRLKSPRFPSHLLSLPFANPIRWSQEQCTGKHYIKLLVLWPPQPKSWAVQAPPEHTHTHTELCKPKSDPLPKYQLDMTLRWANLLILKPERSAQRLSTEVSVWLNQVGEGFSGICWGWKWKLYGVLAGAPDSTGDDTDLAQAAAVFFPRHLISKLQRPWGDWWNFATQHFWFYVPLYHNEPWILFHARGCSHLFLTFSWKILLPINSPPPSQIWKPITELLANSRYSMMQLSVIAIFYGHDSFLKPFLFLLSFFDLGFSY